MTMEIASARTAVAKPPAPGLISRRVLGNVALGLVLLAVPFWLPLVGGYTDLASRVLIYALAAMGLNLLLGFTGGLSFGHAAYFGLGAYGVGLMLKYETHSILLALLVGTLVGGIAATLLGPIAVRRRGIYFAMITIAIGQMFYFLAVRWNSLTGGEDGLTGFSRHPIKLPGLTVPMGSVGFFYLVLVCFGACALLLWTVLNSPLGHTFVGIRENYKRLIFLGVRTKRYLAISFAISGFVVALAGGLNALLDNFTSPNTLNYTLSGDFLIIAVLGGMRNFWGPLAGAVIFILVRDYVSSITDNWMTVIGLIFVLSVLFFPLGILGFFNRKSAS
ncbi:MULTISPECIES: branched-chain amino acid ABC transporter permease [Acidiphilium]|uniref:Branched-chain amino acid ABC transporter permease n=1 Tax=Acidiphilium iwatense TaxID=768198 RepID=A0ABS9DUS1_9PROT|nr:MULTISPECIES: branched-chain amino acid ABC transporter permease [Acidiphilium]MCF3946449.1 branched-chain amino acid ABC transporter permease [Acidiphilium iwatense]